MTACVSLFRAINVGGNRIVSMKDLKAMHEALGLTNVAPYIQSGNVVFHTDSTETESLRAQIEAAFAERFGFHSDVFVRTPSEISAILAANPFQGQPLKEPKFLLVMFLAAHPDEAAQEALKNAYTGPEEFSIIGKEAYIYYTQGVGRSKLTGALLEKKLKTVGTARNINTVQQLLQLLQR